MDSKKPPLRPLVALARSLEKAGLRVFSKLVFDLTGDRDLQDHRDWDQKEHAGPHREAVDALAEGLHAAPGKAVELPPADLRSIEGLSCLEVGSADALDSRELLILEHLDRLVDLFITN